MKTVKLTDTEDIGRFQAAALKLEEGNRQQNEGKKLTDSAKDFFKNWLAEHRRIDVAALPIGDTVLVQYPGSGGMADLVRISVKPTSRLDQKALEMEKPDVKAAFTKAFPTVYYESCLTEPPCP